MPVLPGESVEPSLQQKGDNTKVHASPPETDRFSLLNVASAYELVFAGFVIEK